MTLMHRLTLTVLAALFTITASAEPGTVLVIPARQALVNLGLAVGDQFSRELEVVAYHDKTAVSAGGLFVWDRMNWNWRPVDADAWRRGTGLSTMPPSAIVVGVDQLLPAGLLDGAVANSNVTRLESYDPAQLANALHGQLHFSARQWKRLAADHGLEIVQVNKGQTRGRYGSSPRTTHPEVPADTGTGDVLVPVPVPVGLIPEPVIDTPEAGSSVTTLDVVAEEPEVTTPARLSISAGEVVEVPSTPAVPAPAVPVAPDAVVDTPPATPAVPVAPPPGLMEEVMSPPAKPIIDIPPENK